MTISDYVDNIMSYYDNEMSSRGKQRTIELQPFLSQFFKKHMMRVIIGALLVSTGVSFEKSTYDTVKIYLIG